MNAVTSSKTEINYRDAYEAASNADLGLHLAMHYLEGADFGEYLRVTNYLNASGRAEAVAPIAQYWFAEFMKNGAK